MVALAAVIVVVGIVLELSQKSTPAKATSPSRTSLAKSGVGRAPANSGASGQLQLALRDGLATGSVHQTFTETLGKMQVRQSDDAALRSGRQTIAVSSGVRARVLLVDKVAYISGNDKALVSYFGFPATAARAIGERWVSISANNTAYPTVSASVTVGSALQQITPAGQLATLAPAKIAGQTVIGIRGSLPSTFKAEGTETFYITQSSHPLPVAAVLTFSSGTKHATVETMLSKWGERVSVTAPRNAISASGL